MADQVVAPIPVIKLDIALPKTEPKADRAVFIRQPISRSPVPHYSESFMTDSDYVLELFR